MKKENTALYILRLTATLLAICAVVALALAGVNAITKDKIAAIKAEKDGSGKLVLSFASTEDLETLLTALCGKHFLEELSETL